MWGGGETAYHILYSQFLFDLAQFGLAVGEFNLQVVAGRLSGALSGAGAGLSGAVRRPAGLATLREVLLQYQLHQTLPGSTPRHGHTKYRPANKHK